MVQESRQEQHERLFATSYKVLAKAQEDAARKKGYHSQQTRDELTRLFHERFGTDPFEWQLDITVWSMVIHGILICRRYEQNLR